MPTASTSATASPPNGTRTGSSSTATPSSGTSATIATSWRARSRGPSVTSSPTTSAGTRVGSAGWGFEGLASTDAAVADQRHLDLGMFFEAEVGAGKGEGPAVKRIGCAAGGGRVAAAFSAVGIAAADLQLDCRDRAEVAAQPRDFGPQHGSELAVLPVPDRQRHHQGEADGSVGKEVEQDRLPAAFAAVEGDDLTGGRDVLAQLDGGAEAAAADPGATAPFDRITGAGRLQGGGRAGRQTGAEDPAAAMEVDFQPAQRGGMGAVNGLDLALDLDRDRRRTVARESMRSEVRVEGDPEVVLLLDLRLRGGAPPEGEKRDQDGDGEASAHARRSLGTQRLGECWALLAFREFFQRVRGFAADDVAKGVLDALGAAVGQEPGFRAGLFAGAPGGVATPSPGGARLSQAGGSVEGDWKEEEAEAAVDHPALGEADRDQEEDDQGAEDAAENGAGRAVFDREGGEAEENQHHRGGGDHHRVDRTAPLVRPVDVVEVDPEGELVDRQAGADPEAKGADLEPGAVAEGGEAGGAGDHHRHDPEDEVMDVDAAVADDAAGPPGDLWTPHQPGAHADKGKGEDEPDQDQVEPLQFVLGNSVPEVGEDRSRSHAVIGAECTGGSDRRSPINWIVSRAAASAKTGERVILAAASPSQVATKLSPAAAWIPAESNSLIASPRSSTGTSTQKTSQKLPRTRRTLRSSAPLADRPSSSTTGPARPSQTKARRPGRAPSRRPTTMVATKIRSTAISRP